MGLDGSRLHPYNPRWLAHVLLTSRNRTGLLAGIYMVNALLQLLW